MLHHIILPKLPQEILIMCDDDQLEMTLILALVDNAVHENQQ